MTTIQTLLAFVATASILTITPGLDTAIVLRSSAAGGPRPAAYAAFGIALGCLTWGAAVSIGLGALIAASKIAFTAVKWAGAGYLLYLGLNLISHPRERFDSSDASLAQIDPWRSLRQGLLTNLLNPKIGVFYVTFLPQFVPPGANVVLFSFLLATIHVLLGLGWFTMLIAGTVSMGRVLRRSRVVKAMDRVTGTVFVGFGVKLALSK
jgi:threonine/homoserine/homoserine lactone efflux protein